MRNFMRFGLAVVIAALVLGGSANSTTSSREDEVKQMIRESMMWIKNNVSGTSFRVTGEEQLPQIVFMTADELKKLTGSASDAAYDRNEHVMVVRSDVDIGSPLFRVTIVHETTHHLQVLTRQKYCTAAMEREAYYIQGKWEDMNPNGISEKEVQMTELYGLMFSGPSSCRI